MSYTVVYRLINTDYTEENFTVEDIGNFVIEKQNRSGVKNHLYVSTRDALTDYIKITGKYKKLKVEMGITMFEHQKIIKMIKGFIGGDAYIIKEISKEEFLEEFKKISEIYLKRVDIEDNFMV